MDEVVGWNVYMPSRLAARAALIDIEDLWQIKRMGGRPLTNLEERVVLKCRRLAYRSMRALSYPL
jgi:hypothetical protein